MSRAFSDIKDVKDIKDIKKLVIYKDKRFSNRWLKFRHDDMSILISFNEHDHNWSVSVFDELDRPYAFGVLYYRDDGSLAVMHSNTNCLLDCNSIPISEINAEMFHELLSQ